MDAQSLKQKEIALVTILNKMKVPEMRKEMTRGNIRWLIRNIAVQNSSHPLFGPAKILLRDINKEK